MRLDLHIHSSASDGTCSPAEVVQLASAGGLDVIALADHDTMAGVKEARDAARDCFLEVIPAMELSSSCGDEDVHILGYFLDVTSSAVAAHQRRGLSRRVARMAEMRRRLARQGYPITEVQLDSERRSADVAPARPHLARALVKAGWADSVPAAFAKLIGRDCPAYVSAEVATPEEVIRCVLDAGGIPVWAHPPKSLLDELLPRLVDAGLRGLEVYRPPGRSANPVVLEEVARREGLLVTGGSDWHGPAGRRRLGDFFVTGDEVARFLDIGGL